MMAKMIALFSLFAFSLLNTLGNFWFTYGIWPRSWGAFVLFWFTGMIIYLLMTKLTEELRQE